MNLKRMILFIALIYFIVCMGMAQDTLTTKWVLREASSIPLQNAEAWAIGTDQIGNVIWGVNKDMEGLELMNALVYKMDEDANLVWVDTAATGDFAQQSYNLKVTDSLIYLGGKDLPFNKHR